MASSSPGGNYHHYKDPTSIPDSNDESNQDQSGLYNEQRESDSDDESSITLTSSDNSYSDSDNSDDGDEFERFAAYKG